MMNPKRFLLSTSSLALFVLPQLALAQEGADQASDPPSEEATTQGRTEQEIVVTAERRLSTSQRTAASISVRSGEDMLAQGRYDLESILEDVPGVDGGAALTTGTSQGSGTDNPASGLTFRGIQSNTGAGGSVTSTAAAAAIYVDDVHSGIGGSYDIERVEVLRGPQGTLYGRSATAGVVAIHTADPDTSQFEGGLAVEVGDYEMRHVTGAVNVPIIEDKLAVRVSGNFYERDGYYSAEGGAMRTEAFRVKALWTPTEDFSALLGYAQEYNVTNSGGVTINPGTSPDTFTYTPQVVSPPGKNHFRQYWGQFDLDLGQVAITYIPMYRTWYQNATIYLRGVLAGDQTVSTPTDWFMTHELRIRNTDNSARLQWQAGVLYYENTLDSVNNLYMFPNGPFAFKSNSHKETSAQGAFAEAIYSFTPETRLTVGARYDHTDTLTTGDYTSILGITQTLTGDEGRRKFNNFTYKARLEHDLTPRNLLYAVVSTGFSPGDVTLTTDATFRPVVEVLDAETLTAYEIGSKNRFFGNRLQINGALYYNDYSGYQTAGINTSPQTPETPTFATIALPMRSYGAELEARILPWDNGTISINGAYTNAEYTDFGAHEALFFREEVPGIAPFQGSVAYDHRVDLGEATLLLRGDVRYASAHDTGRLPDSQAAAGGAPYVRVSGEAVANLSATLLLGKRYSVTAYVRNVTDNRYIPDGWGLALVIPSMTPGGSPTVSADAPALSDPRTFGAVFGFRF